jgi:2-polyprenyl-3-methyl-5-hydroxy-6-metoxy-1,4-benzoquinol methylase
MRNVTDQNEIVKTPNGVEWQPKKSFCPMCKEDDYKIIGVRGGEFHRDKLGIETQVVQCRHCSLYYTNPTLLPLSNPYAEEGEYFVKHDKNWKVEYGGELAEKVEKIIGRKGRLIEPACGPGDFLRGAQKKGWEVCGVEMTESFVFEGQANGLDIEFASVEESKYLEEKYDAIFMLAMLEHLYDPISMLKKANNALTSDGIAVINVPNEVTSLVNLMGNRYVKSFYGKNWTMSLSPTFAPYHVVGFSPKSLKYALNETGFDIVTLETISGVSVLPSPKGLKQKLESVGLNFFLLAGKFADKLNRGNEIWCWAQKR